MAAITVSGVEFSWPDSDRDLQKVAETELPVIDKALAHVTDTRVAIQAGGACGVFPYFLSRHFDLVYTMEASEANFQFLRENTKDCRNRDGLKNVMFMMVPIGDGHAAVDIERNPRNVGAQKVIKNGKIKTVAVDDLALSSCGLLMLDIEGYELMAIHGAIDTIQRYAPVIVLELNGLDHDFHGFRKNAARKAVEQLGYKEVDRHGRDVIFVRS